MSSPGDPQTHSDRTTSLSLLARIRASDESAWERFVHIYTPLVAMWCRKYALQPTDVADITQEVFSGVSRGIENFRKEKAGDSFRGWLWTIASRRIKDHYRRLNRQSPGAGGTDAHLALQSIPDQLEEDSDELLAVADSPVHRTLELIQIEFEDRTWKAFWSVAVDGRDPADVAEALDMSRMAVYKAKSRVLQRLRSELEGLVELTDE